MLELQKILKNQKMLKNDKKSKKCGKRLRKVKIMKNAIILLKNIRFIIE
jgi:hypothetical protein